MKSSAFVHGEPSRTRVSGTRANWKPFTFNPLFILFLVALHVLHIVGIQLLINQRKSDEPQLQRVQRNGTETDYDSVFIFGDADVTTYLAWQYLPVGIIVLIAAIWELVDMDVRRLAPFVQLASNEGGNAYNALCLDYTSIFGLTTPFSALQRRHWNVALCSTMYILVSIVLPAISGSIFAVEFGAISFSQGRVAEPTFAIVTINKGLATVTQALHGVMAGSALLLSILLLLQHTGLYHDPKGLGGIVSLVSDADRSGCTTLELFRQIPPFAHSDVISSALGNISFRLEHFAAFYPDGSTYMTYQLSSKSMQGYIVSINPSQRSYYRNDRDSRGLWLTKRIAWLSEVFLWLGHAAITAALYYTARFVGVATSSSSVSRVAIGKVVLTACMTIGGMMWISIQREVQRFEPWRKLAGGRTSRLYTSMVRGDIVSRAYLGGALMSIVLGSLMALWASICVFMVQAATIFVPPLMEFAATPGSKNPETGEQTMGIFEVLSFQAMMAMVGVAVGVHLMIFFNLIFLSFNKRTVPFLPRAPTTIASQLLYVCHSDRLLSTFEGTSMLTGRELADRLRSVESFCLFGWFTSPRSQVQYVGVERCDHINQWSPFQY
ncbi:hypothetical protein B0I35DRAFT_409002 [Stachybotrys elegans]|uniref:Uncharacterized protein n=1 Tax=Stachybotrys elegans TaxID=80388 RepID=A0A8K0SQU7_9HYPO|nr:hypothetical protein B0I35DRAFT_409002 [Stachybotrys elegans]